MDLIEVKSKVYLFMLIRNKRRNKRNKIRKEGKIESFLEKQRYVKLRRGERRKKP